MHDRVSGRPSAHAALAFYDDQHPPAGDFLADVLDGFSRVPKQLTPVYFYDAKGSAIFDEITELPEYYVTRTELDILDQIGTELAALAGPGAVVIEPGSGSSVKIRKLLNALTEPAAYVGLDISGEHLETACQEIAADYPNLQVGAICADFTKGLDLNHLTLESGRRLIFFPGSTIGNFEPDGARELLAGFRSAMRPGDAVLIGADRVKDPDRLVAAYDDSAGVTARFNLNLIDRINEELDGRIDPSALRHEAVWNAQKARIEMHLVAIRDLHFTVSGQEFELREGESIHTENSHKFTPESFTSLAESVGFDVLHSWSDPADLFTLHWLEPADKA
ncbi:L-histidine N(alpha)-methyltransferase [uncultured Maricaulis sp.]|uniref:L-histidine N(alpha)-methyltransferase n=1 Tax=uncultured Maricaulis sp. TaxID=174710 RepID=UPI002628DA53|nr:L-histidine N(alpha)-methyltransferase [uncultured Maricaulis sp.]